MSGLEPIVRPDLTDTLQLVFEALKTSLRVALPGVVEEYDATKHQATIQPLLMLRPTKDAAPKKLATIPNVPIVFPRTAKGALVLPIDVGDAVTLLFSDRGLDQWKAGAGDLPVEPNSTRKHALPDCWAIPGGYPEGKLFTAHSEGNLELQVAPGTKVYIGNGTDELLQIANDAFTSLKSLAEEIKTVLGNMQTMTVLVSTAPLGVAAAWPPIPADIVKFAASEAAVNGFISEIEAEISSLGNIKA